jgi:predicted transcriptional regulator
MSTVVGNLRTIQVTIRPDQDETLREFARQQDRPVSRVVREALDAFFAAREGGEVNRDR